MDPPPAVGATAAQGSNVHPQAKPDEHTDGKQQEQRCSSQGAGAKCGVLCAAHQPANMNSTSSGV